MRAHVDTVGRSAGAFRAHRLGVAWALGTLLGAVAPVGGEGQEADAGLLEAVSWYTGVAGRVDDERARALLETAAQDGDPISVMWLARCHSRGRMGFERDEALARSMARGVIHQIRALARTGNLEATFLMGTAFDEGLGVEPDAQEAARWHRRAAEAGHVLAQHNLGNAYASGRGVPASDAEAVRWWRPAADAGDAIAQLRLGEMHEAGRGVEADLAQARYWYGEAARRGNTAAREALLRLGGGG